MDSFLHNVQAKAGAGGSGAGTVKHIEHLVEVYLGNPLPLVFDSDGSAVIFYNSRYLYIDTTIAAIPDCIAQKIVEDDL